MANAELDNLRALGVPEQQIGLLAGHVARAMRYVYPEDMGLPEAGAWLKKRLEDNLPGTVVSALARVVADNPPDLKVEYGEKGYDSCQSHRKLAKVVGEAMLIGGLVHEARMVGLELSIEGAKSMVGSTNFEVGKRVGEKLVQAAGKFGAAQDFIFPGVTPSDKQTLTLEQLAVKALAGEPETTVRTLTGVGGLRSDREWNYVTDFKTFVELKVAEDKRYYPGIGLFYLWLKGELQKVPLVQRSEPLAEFGQCLDKVEEKKLQGVSVLCSSFVPRWDEMKEWQGHMAGDSLEMAEAFHSPSYEFATLYSVVKSLKLAGELGERQSEALKLMARKLAWLWSFNSTIHLPWTANLAGLANDLMGRITNGTGDTGLRYGVGYQGKSLEVRELVYGVGRSFPIGLGGRKVYVARYYNQSDNFEGNYECFPVVSDTGLWIQTRNLGFLRAVLEFLEYE